MKILITGANGNLGSNLINFFSKDQKNLIFGLDIHDSSIIKKNNYHYSACDITSSENVNDFFKSLDSDIDFDSVVNNASFAVFDDFSKRKKSDFMSVLETNIYGPFNIIQKLVTNSKYNKNFCKIINIGSIYGSISSDPSIYDDLDRKNSEVYSASKAAVISLTKYFSVHLANKNIVVNTVSPGGIFNDHPPIFKSKYSQKVPLSRMANIEEVVSVIDYLASTKNHYLTGQNINIDGGMLAW
jgi:3-oxoacyl-[acyl-carrier protein] reductase